MERTETTRQVPEGDKKKQSYYTKKIVVVSPDFALQGLHRLASYIFHFIHIMVVHMTVHRSFCHSVSVSALALLAICIMPFLHEGMSAVTGGQAVVSYCVLGI